MERNLTNNLYYDTTVKSLTAALPGLILAAYSNKSELNLIAYRQHTQALASFLKLHSEYNVDTAIDCFSTDTPETKYRFTVTYLLQSSQGNLGYTVSTKTTEVLALLSMQSVFPAFN